MGKRRVLEKLKITEISGVDRPCQEHAVVAIMKRDFSGKKREKDAKSGAAMPDGSYPIETRGDLENAIQAFGRAKNKEAVRRHIISRARSLGCTDCIPDGWVAKSLAERVDALKKSTETIEKFWSIAARLAAVAARRRVAHAIGDASLSVARSSGLNFLGRAAQAHARVRTARRVGVSAILGGAAVVAHRRRKVS